MDQHHPAGKVIALTGDALAVTDQGERVLSLGSSVFQGETIVTKAGSQIEIDFADDTALSQGENSRSLIDTFVYDPDQATDSSFLLEMTQGVFRTVTGEIANQNPDQFKLKSPMALIGIRGTVVDSDIRDGFESIGVETIGTGHVLVVQDSQGNIQFISDPLQILDILANQPLSPPRPITREELNNFQNAAPNAVDNDPAHQAELEARLDAAEAEAALEEAEQAAEEAEKALEKAQAEGDAEAIAEAETAAAQAEEALKAAQEAAKAAEDALNQLTPEDPEGYEPGDEDGQSGNQNTYTVIGLIETDDQGNLTFYEAGDGQGSENQGQEGTGQTGTDDPEDVNIDPVAADDSAETDEDTSVTINVLANDEDADGDALTISSITDAANGEVVISGDQIIYTPDAGFSGTDTFSYTVSDGNGGTDTATVSVAVTAAATQPSDAVIDSAGETYLVNTLGGDNGFGEDSLERNDDGYSEEIDINSVFPDGLYLYGETYTSLYINTNGTISFDYGSGDYYPEDLNLTDEYYPVMIAPFWADVETSVAPSEGSETPGGNSTGTNLIYYDFDAENHIFTVTWDDVGYFNDHTDHLNAFQVQIVEVGEGTGNFDVLFRYEDINWATTDSDGIARIGITAWDGTNYIEIDPSGKEEDILALEDTRGNGDQEGYWEIKVRDGEPQVSLSHDLYDDTITGSEEEDIDTLRGYLGDDLIQGSYGDELLMGESGDDTLEGGYGSDVLSGGPGTDVFIISDSESPDTILDFDGDIIRFDEGGLGFHADGSEDYWFETTGEGSPDPSWSYVIAITDSQVQGDDSDPWAQVISVINNAIYPPESNDATGTYFILNNGNDYEGVDGDTRIYYWEDIPNSDTTKVDEGELTLLAELKGVSLTEIADMDQDNFQIVDSV